MKLFLSTCFALQALSSYCQQKQKKILIVSTNNDSVGNNVSGTFLMEIAYPFQYFIANGFDVDILTPKGGKAAVYHSGKMPDDLAAIQNDSLFMQKTENSLSPVQVNAVNYAAIYYPGGHGQFFDVVSDERIANIAWSIHKNGGAIGSAGHGTASLINILDNGNFFVKGKTLTSFPSWAEKLWMTVSNYGKLLPFDMQEVLARRGAKLIISARETMSDTTLTRVIDKENRIVTASFATGAKWVAEEMRKLIKNKG